LARGSSPDRSGKRKSASPRAEVVVTYNGFRCMVSSRQNRSVAQRAGDKELEVIEVIMQS